jgi:hypothetical protein
MRIASAGEAQQQFYLNGRLRGAEVLGHRHLSTAGKMLPIAASAAEVCLRLRDNRLTSISKIGVPNFMDRSLIRPVCPSARVDLPVQDFIVGYYRELVCECEYHCPGLLAVESLLG